MKYIIFDERYPVIFPVFLSHDEVARLYEYKGIGKPTSAGFIRLNSSGKKLFPHGKSISLNLQSRAEDASIINRLLDPIQ